MQKKETIILILLILLSINATLRTLVYILFDNNLLNLDEYFGITIENITNNILFIFSIIRTILVLIVLNLRNIRNDIITYVLICLLFFSFLRFYYQYLVVYTNERKQIYYIDKFQDINSIIIFFCSVYIMKHILLG